MEKINCNIELKTLAESGYFTGYASVFDYVDKQQDVILSGAFKSAKPEKVKLLWQHDFLQPIGIIKHLSEDDYGLFVEGKFILDIQRAREAYALLKNGAISGLSIGYNVKDSAYDAETAIRLIRSVELHEISIVTFPANDLAEVTAVKNSV